MKVSNLKDLQKLLKVCQENGVDAIKIPGEHGQIEMSIRPVTKPTRSARTLPSAVFSQPTPDEQLKVPVPFQETPEAPDIETPDELSEEQLLNWSSGATQ